MDFSSLCTLSDDELASIDVAEFSLRVAADLPGSEGLDIPDTLARLNAWSHLVEVSTARWESSFWKSPERLNNSLAQFKACAMLTVVQRDLGVRYNMDFIEGPPDGRDSRNLFLHGPLLGHGGTCASLPPLYLAIGQRLGYPLYLVEAKQHLLLRWQDSDERFNVECTSPGFAPRDDDHYRSGRYALNPRERTSRRFLVNKAPRQVLAEIIAKRAWCLLDNLSFASGLVAAHAAAKLDDHMDPLWYLATVPHNIDQVLDQHEKTVRVPPQMLVEIARPRVRQRWQMEIHPDVAADYCRIVGLHRADWQREFLAESDLVFKELGQIQEIGSIDRFQPSEPCHVRFTNRPVD